MQHLNEELLMFLMVGWYFIYLYRDNLSAKGISNRIATYAGIVEDWNISESHAERLVEKYGVSKSEAYILLRIAWRKSESYYGYHCTLNTMVRDGLLKRKVKTFESGNFIVTYRLNINTRWMVFRTF